MLKRGKVVLKNTSSHPDWFFLGLVLGLTAFGLAMVGNASVVEAFRDFGDKLYYFRLQLQWAGVGIIALIFTLNFHYRNWRKLAVPLLILALVFLIILFFSGLGVQVLGAKRWLRLGGFRFQPSELAKFAFILWSAAFLSEKRKLLPFLTLLILFLSLIMLQPDLGTAVILAASGLVIWFTSGVAIWQIGLVGILGVIAGAGLIFSSSYRKERLLTFLNPGRDPLGASYHIRQILIALGSGGLFGLGLGQSRQKFEYLPEATTDSIFAVIAEEIGFLGASFLILLFLLIIWRGLRIAKMAPDNFSRLLAIGITAWIGIQALVNLAAMVALVPLTGVPLPFISYGGSSLVLILTGVGILANISRYRVVKK